MRKSSQKSFALDGDPALWVGTNGVRITVKNGKKFAEKNFKYDLYCGRYRNDDSGELFFIALVIQDYPGDFANAVFGHPRFLKQVRSFLQKKGFKRLSSLNFTDISEFQNRKRLVVDGAIVPPAALLKKLGASAPLKKKAGKINPATFELGQIATGRQLMDTKPGLGIGKSKYCKIGDIEFQTTNSKKPIKAGVFVEFSESSQGFLNHLYVLFSQEDQKIVKIPRQNYWDFRVKRPKSLDLLLKKMGLNLGGIEIFDKPEHAKMMTSNGVFNGFYLYLDPDKSEKGLKKLAGQFLTNLSSV